MNVSSDPADAAPRCPLRHPSQSATIRESNDGEGSSSSSVRVVPTSTSSPLGRTTCIQITQQGNGEISAITQDSSEDYGPRRRSTITTTTHVTSLPDISLVSTHEPSGGLCLVAGPSSRPIGIGGANTAIKPVNDNSTMLKKKSTTPAKEPTVNGDLKKPPPPPPPPPPSQQNNTPEPAQCIDDEMPTAEAGASKAPSLTTVLEVSDSTRSNSSSSSLSSSQQQQKVTPVQARGFAPSQPLRPESAHTTTAATSSIAAVQDHATTPPKEGITIINNISPPTDPPDQRQQEQQPPAETVSFSSSSSRDDSGGGTPSSTYATCNSKDAPPSVPFRPESIDTSPSHLVPTFQTTTTSCGASPHTTTTSFVLFGDEDNNNSGTVPSRVGSPSPNNSSTTASSTEETGNRSTLQPPNNDSITASELASDDNAAAAVAIQPVSHDHQADALTPKNTRSNNEPSTTASATIHSPKQLAAAAASSSSASAHSMELLPNNSSSHHLSLPDHLVATASSSKQHFNIHDHLERYSNSWPSPPPPPPPPPTKRRQQPTTTSLPVVVTTVSPATAAATATTTTKRTKRGLATKTTNATASASASASAPAQAKETPQHSASSSSTTPFRGKTTADVAVVDDPSEHLQILSVLEEGQEGSSFGAAVRVYKARHIPTETAVAVKVISPHNQDISNLTKIKQEIDILCQIDSPYITRYLECFLKQPQQSPSDSSRAEELWIVMELPQQEGGGGATTTVADFIGSSNTMLPEDSIRRFCASIVLGLECLHNIGLCNRDIRCRNLYLTNNGHVKLGGGFGIPSPNHKQQKHLQVANANDNNNPADTTTNEEGNTIEASLYWMAPEVIRDESRSQSYDATADIWSLGITIIEMAQGVPPHYNLHPLRARFVIPAKPPPTLPADSNNHWSREMVDFVNCCCQKDPNQRHTATQLSQHPFVRQEVSLLEPRRHRRTTTSHSRDDAVTRHDEESPAAVAVAGRLIHSPGDYQLTVEEEEEAANNNHQEEAPPLWVRDMDTGKIIPPPGSNSNIKEKKRKKKVKRRKQLKAPDAPGDFHEGDYDNYKEATNNNNNNDDDDDDDGGLKFLQEQQDALSFPNKSGKSPNHHWLTHGPQSPRPNVNRHLNDHETLQEAPLLHPPADIEQASSPPPPPTKSPDGRAGRVLVTRSEKERQIRAQQMERRRYMAMLFGCGIVLTVVVIVVAVVVLRL